MSLVYIENTKDPELYVEKSNYNNVYQLLSEMGISRAMQIIRELFNEYFREYGYAVEIRPINRGFSNTGIFRFCVGYVENKHMRVKKEFILKLGVYREIYKEKQNYLNLISGHDLAFVPKLLGFHDINQEFAGISYEGLKNTQTFRDYYSTQKEDSQIINFIDNLYDKTEQAWYRNSHTLITELHVKQYDLNKSLMKFHAGINAYLSNSELKQQIKLPLESPVFCENPLSFIHKWEKDRHFITNISTVHGDMQTENILIDEISGELYLIDFGDMQPDGHIFKDYVKLEADILFRLLDYRESENGTFDNEWLSLVSFCLGYETEIKETPEIIRAMRCIQKIRNRAYNLKADLMEPDDWETEYLVGLLYWTLTTVYWKEIQPSKRKLAFYTSALICDAIKKIENKEIELLK